MRIKHTIPWHRNDRGGTSTSITSIIISFCRHRCPECFGAPKEPPEPTGVCFFGIATSCKDFHTVLDKKMIETASMHATT